MRELLRLKKGFLESRVEAQSFSIEDQNDWGGCTPLMLAAKFGRFGVTKLLLEKGAESGKMNKDGATLRKMTASDYALDHGHEAVASLLAAHLFQKAVSKAKSPNSVRRLNQTRGKMMASLRQSMQKSDRSSMRPSSGIDANNTVNIW